MQWKDTQLIGETLADLYPDIDPLKLRFTELHAMVVALQDFELKKAAYAAEIAKSASGTPPTAQFNAAAAAYTAAKTYTEQLADQLFPPEVPEEIQASSMTVTAVSSGTAAEEVQPAEKKASTQTVSK